MSPAVVHFTPLASLLGGLAIGAAAAIYLLGAGRIAGISGVLATALQSLRTRVPGAGPAWAFVAGLLLAPTVWRLVAPLPAAQAVAGPGTIVIAGLLVGFGARLGGGCTSGHGVCGLGRRSPRSLAHVATFIAAGAATVFVLRHLP